ncbi:hypothetical protein BPAP50_gp28 [Bacillus phage AP50]|uniref:Uncharacterized protein n=1 Tax=Bacillus phage AP50 TaxID=2880538 RepID=B6RT60_9VIRU|nr:hypothetical protein BPAP50_gp28 [Bacillus phage AP50]ACB54927.1 hypothetical protein [Bacillus phage AP50]
MGLKKPSGAPFMSAQGESFVTIESQKSATLEINNLSFTPNMIVIRCETQYGEVYQMTYHPFQMIYGINVTRGVNVDKNRPTYLSNDSYGLLTPSAKGFNAKLTPDTDIFRGSALFKWKAYYFPSVKEEAEKPF